MVRTWCFHCGGLGSICGWGTEILQAARHGQTQKEGINQSVELFLILQSKRMREDNHLCCCP